MENFSNKGNIGAILITITILIIVILLLIVIATINIFMFILFFKGFFGFSSGARRDEAAEGALARRQRADPTSAPSADRV